MSIGAAEAEAKSSASIERLGELETSAAAEVQRLEKLGAKRVAAVRTWVVMEAPDGQRFCVIRQGHKYFDETANRWNEEGEQQ